MWLSGRQPPDFRIISDFRKDRLGDIKKLFEQVVAVCINLGMARVGTVFVDGTIFRACANKNKMQYRKVLEKRRTRIKQQIDDIFKEAEDIDKREDEIYGETTPHTTGQPLTNELKQKIEEQLNKPSKKQLNKIKRKNKPLIVKREYLK